MATLQPRFSNPPRPRLRLSFKPVYAGRFSSTRDNVLTGLVSGTIYAVQVRAQGGNSQFSDWCLPITIMCT